MNTNLSNDDRELIHQLLEDTDIISRTVTIGRPKPAVIRATLVPLLRKWITESGFFKAAKLIYRHRPTFNIWAGSNEINLCKSGVYEHWMAGVRFDTISISISQISEKYLSNTPISVKNIPVSQRGNVFFKQKVFFWKKAFYTRHDLILMHANRLGGVHLDFRRAPSESHINEIKNYFGFEVKTYTHQMLVGQEIAEARADPDRRDHVYDAAELVAMDTARIFAEGILASQPIFEAVLRGQAGKISAGLDK